LHISLFGRAETASVKQQLTQHTIHSNDTNPDHTPDFREIDKNRTNNIMSQPPPPPLPLQSNPTTTTTNNNNTRFIELKANQEDEIKRRKTCRFIEEAGRVLKLPRVAISTAEVFFHRFYAKHSFQDHDRFEVAVAAIVLAAKTEEAPKKLNIVIQECYKLKARGMQAGRISSQSQPTILADGSNNNNCNSSPSSPSIHQQHHQQQIVFPSNLDPKGDDFLKLKDRILLLERIILHTIGFELSIDHPYKVSGN
jgi:hypothetical protein